MLTNKTPQTIEHKFIFVSGDKYSIEEECEYISDEEIEKLMVESTSYEYLESYY